MKASVFLIGTVAVLTACNAPSTASKNASSQANDCKQEAIAASTNAYTPLPEVVTFTPAFHVRKDRIYTTPKGVRRRNVNLEILQGDAVQASTVAGESLLKSGFKAVPVPTKGDGITRLAFDKPGYGRININARTDVGDKPSNPDAVGVVVFDWPLQAPVAKPSQAAASTAN